MATQLDAYHAAKKRLVEFDRWKGLLDKDKDSRLSLSVTLGITVMDRQSHYPREEVQLADGDLPMMIRADVLASISTYLNQYRARLIESIRVARIGALNELADLIKEELPS